MTRDAFARAYKYFNENIDTIHIWPVDVDDVDFVHEGCYYYAHIRHIIYYMRLVDGKIGLRKGEIHRFILN